MAGDAVIIGKVAVKVVPQTEGFRDDVEDMLDRLERQLDLEIHVDLNAASKAKVQAELALLARSREASIRPTIDKAAATKAAATLAALSGGRSVNDITQDVGEWLGDLDRAVPRIATATTALGNLASVTLTSSANLLSLGSSLATVAQGSIALPGIFGGIAIGMGATVAVLKDFNKELPQVKRDLKDLQNSMSAEFWSVAREPIREMVDSLFPQLERSLIDTSGALGDFFANLAGSSKGQFGKSLDGMFDGLNDSIDEAGKHTDSFVGIIDKLGSVGADNLPRLAGWVGDVADQFDNWLEKSDLQGFVDTGTEALQDLGMIAVFTGRTFRDLAAIAEESGASTLDTLRRTMKGVSETVASPSFQKPLRNLFSGAREGLDELTAEAGDEFKSFIERLANTLGEGLPILGRTAGKALEGIFDALDQSNVQDSVIGLFESIESAVSTLAPVLPGVADGLAGIVDVVGALAEGVAQALASGLEDVGPAVADLTQDLVPLVEQLTELLDIGIDAAGPVFSSLADTMGTLASTTASVLEPINVLLRLLGEIPGLGESATFLASLGIIVGATTWLGAGVRGKIVGIGTSIRSVGDSAFVASSKVQNFGAKVQGLAGGITAGKSAMVGLGIAGSTVASEFGLTNTVLGATIGSILPGIGTAMGAAAGAVVDLTIAIINADDAANALTERFAQLGGALSEPLDLALETGDLGAMTDEVDRLRAALANAEEEGNKVDIGVFTEQLYNAESATRNFKDGLAEVAIAMGALQSDVKGIDVLRQLPGELEAQTMDQVKQALDALNISVEDFIWTNARGGDAAREMIREVANWISTADSASARTDAVTEAFAALDNKMVNASSAASNLRNAMSALTNPATNLIVSTDNWNQSLADLKNQLSKTNQGLMAQTNAGRANRAVIVNSARGLIDLVVAQADAGKSSAFVQRQFIKQREALIRNATAVLGNRKEVVALLRQMNLTPKLVETLFRSKGLGKVKGDTKDLNSDLKNTGKVKPSMDGWVQTIRDKVKGAEADAKRQSSNIEKELKNLKPGKPDLSEWTNGIRQGIGEARNVATTGGFEVGAALKQGVINGFSGTQAALVQQAVAAVRAAVQAAKNEGKIKSPSRVMMEVGRDLGLGMAVGLARTRDDVEKAAVDITRSALRGYKKIENLLDKSLSKIEADASKAFKKRHAEDIKRLRQLSAEYDKAWSKLQRLLQQQKSFEQSVRQSIIDSGNPTGFEIVTPEGIITGMEDAVAQAEDFRKVLRKLKKEGLNKTTLKQILAAGPEAGLSVAESILAGGVNQVNQLQRELNRIGKDLGVEMGDHLFGDLVSDAQNDVDKLVKKLKPLADKLRQFARDLVGALREQLDKEFNKGGKDRSGKRRWTLKVETTPARRGDTSRPRDDGPPNPTGGPGGSATVLNYYAAPGEQISAEERLFSAVARARM